MSHLKFPDTRRLLTKFHIGFVHPLQKPCPYTLKGVFPLKEQEQRVPKITEAKTLTNFYLKCSIWMCSKQWDGHNRFHKKHSTGIKA